MWHTANSWRNAWVCVTKLWNVCFRQRPQSRPWRNARHLRLLTHDRVQRVALPEDTLRLHSWQVRCTCVQMTMNNGSKLWSSADARLKQWKSSRSWLVCTDIYARELHNALLWPLATWPREVLLALYECDFDGVSCSADAGMYRELTECFRGWESSWSIEL